MKIRGMKMKKMILVSLVAICALLCDAKALKVLMIGNSFSESVLRQMPDVAKSISCE